MHDGVIGILRGKGVHGHGVRSQAEDVMCFPTWDGQR